MMQSKWNRIQSGTARGTWVALLSVLVILLFAAAASGAAAQSVVLSQVTAYPGMPQTLDSEPSYGAGVFAGDNGAGSSWGVNSSGNIVASGTYGNTIFQWNGPGYAVTEVGPFSNAGGVGIDSGNYLYIGGQYGTTLFKVPMNTDGTYSFVNDPTQSGNGYPTCVGPVTTAGVTTNDTVACLIMGPGSSTMLNYFGTAAFAFDASGTLYFTTDDQGGLYGGAGLSLPYTIYQCNTTCLYGPTFTAPVVIFSEPVDAAPTTDGVGQYFIGAMSFDPWGNLWFTDAAEKGTGGAVYTSNLNELIKTGSTLSTTKTVVETLTNAAAGGSNEIDSVVVSNIPSTTNLKQVNVYFSLLGGGIYALHDNNSVADPTSLWSISNLSPKLLMQDSQGNFFAMAYSNTNSADSLYYVSLSGPTFPGNPPAATVANLIAADNGVACTATTPALTGISSNTDYAIAQVDFPGNPTATPPVAPYPCTAMTLGTGSYAPLTVTLTLGTGETVAPSTSMTVTDTTSSASASVGVKGPAPISVDQSTWGQQFETAAGGQPGGGVFGGQSAGGSSGGINSMGTVVIGSSYGSAIQEFTAGGTVIANIGNANRYGGAAATFIDKNDYLYVSSEYGGTLMLKFPMDPTTGLYPAVPAATAAFNAIPACAGDGVAPDNAGICKLNPGSATMDYGVASLTGDANGTLFIATGNATPSSTVTNVPFSILECPVSCLYGATPTAPTVLFTEPGPDSLGDQLFVGGIAVDPSENLFFTDDMLDGPKSSSGYNHYSDLYELAFSGGAYATTPTLLETLAPACGTPPCLYNNELDSVATDASGNVFFADQYTGIYELVNNGGTFDALNPTPYAQPGAKVIIPDGKGNFYFAAYYTPPGPNGAGGDTIGFDLVGSVAIAGQATPTSPTTATVYALDNFPCASTPTLDFVFGDTTDFLVPATAPGCTDLNYGNSSSISQTITFQPADTTSGTINTTLTVTDTTNGGTGTAAVTALAATAQTITGFAGITSPVVYGAAASYTLSADTGPAGNAPVFTIDGTSTIASITGNTLTITGAGTFTIDVNMLGGVVGGVTYANAPQLQVPIEVDPAPQVIAPPTATTVMYNATVDLATTGGLSGNPLTYTIDAADSTGTGTLSGSVLTGTGLGTVVVDINQTGNTDYLAATQVPVSITVTQAAQTIVISASPTAPTYPATSAITAAGGASGNAVTLAITTGSSIATLSGTTLTPTGAAFGAVVVTANQLGNTDYAAAAPATVTVTFAAAATVATPTITPASGNLTVGVNNTITIADATTGAAIYYTTDGTDPLAAGGTGVLYAAPFTLPASSTPTVVTAAATLLGDTPSADATATYNVTTLAPTFTITASPTTATVTSSTPAVITITLAPNATFTSAITFACTGTGVTCAFSPASITPPTDTTTLTISKSATAALHNGPNPFLPAGATFAIALGFLGWKKRRGIFLAAVLLAGILGMMQLTACGGSSAKTSTVTVTATGGGVTQTVPLTITVK